MPERLVGVWVLERTEGGDPVRPHGVLLLCADGWFSMQVEGARAWSGHYGTDSELFLLEPVISSAPGDLGRIHQWRWAFDGDVLTLAGPDVGQRWHREGSDVVTGIGTE